MTGSVVPPAPPSINPVPDRLQRMLLLGLLVAGIVLFAVGRAHWLPYAALVQRGGLYLAIYALLVTASWLPAGVLSLRVDAFLDRWVGSSSSGWYGVMAIATFAKLELDAILEALRDFGAGSIDWRGALVQWAMGFSVDGLLNAVWASIWPFLLISECGSTVAGVFIAATWAMYWAGGRVLPHARIEAARARKQKSRGSETQ